MMTNAEVVGWTDTEFSHFLCDRCHLVWCGIDLTRKDVREMNCVTPITCDRCGKALLDCEKPDTTRSPREMAAEATAIRLRQIADALAAQREELDDLYCELRGTALRDDPKRRHLVDMLDRLTAVTREVAETAYALSPVR